MDSQGDLVMGQVDKSLKCPRPSWRTGSPARSASTPTPGQPSSLTSGSGRCAFIRSIVGQQ